MVKGNKAGTTLRVLMVAQHASARYGGEALLPLVYFKGLRARGVDVWLLVHERTRAELAEALAGDADRLVFTQDTWVHMLLFWMSRRVPRRVGETVFAEATNLLTQREQKRQLRPLLTEHCVVYQPIPIMPRSPSLMYGLNVPVLIGPLNGGMDFPPAYRSREPLAVRLAVRAARAASVLVNWVARGKRDAAVVMVANERTRRALPVRPKGVVIVTAENGVTVQPLHEAETPRTADHLFLFIGRLVDWKALEVVLEALAAVPGARLEVIGDGVMCERWKAIARSAGVEDRVCWLGFQPASVCAERLQASTALVLPSLLEAGGAVVLQAMSAARPVIATRWGGPAEYLDSSCGILVEPAGHDAMVGEFAAAMRRLMAAPELCSEMGRSGRRRVEEVYDWEKKIDHLQALFAQVQQPQGLQAMQVLPAAEVGPA